MLALLILVLLMIEIDNGTHNSNKDGLTWKRRDRPGPCRKKKIEHKLRIPSLQGPPKCVKLVRYYPECISKA